MSLDLPVLPHSPHDVTCGGVTAHVSQFKVRGLDILNRAHLWIVMSFCAASAANVAVCRILRLSVGGIRRNPSLVRTSLFKYCTTSDVSTSTSSTSSRRLRPLRNETEVEGVELPPPPTDCCMSGCANCVWIAYGEELARIYKDGGTAAVKVLDTIEDPSLKVFVSLELRERFKSGR